MKMKHARIFVADEIDESGINLLQSKGFDVIKCYGLKNDALIEKISGYKSSPNSTPASSLIIRTTRKLNKKDISFLKSLTDIKLLCAASSGYDNIDVNEAKRQNMHVTNCPDSTYISAAEHTFALLLAIEKNLIESVNDMQQGIFDFRRYRNSELSGKTIGIIGVGRVGSQVAKIARAFGMKVFGNDVNRNLASKYKWISFMSLEKLLAGSDTVTVHTPLDKSTKNLINKVNIRLMKKSAILLNCARGGIVNESALIQAIKSDRLYFAGIDVFVNEPDFDRNFTKSGRVILTPHLAGKTVESRKKVSLQLAERIIKYYNGQQRSISIC